MLTITAKTVYIDPDVDRRFNCRKRLERLRPNIRCDDVRELDAAALDKVLQIPKRRHGKDDFGDGATLVFTTFDERRADWFYHWRDEAMQVGGACQPALELNLVDGCVFRCAYCGFGRYVVFHLDVERLIEGLDSVWARHEADPRRLGTLHGRAPGQRLYKYSNMTDLPPFEPELDAIRPMVERFARERDRYLMLFTKSDNVGFLEPLDHRGHTIISWSVTCDTVSRHVDKGTATMQERIAAMERMQKAGYLVRARLSPIVPVRNWREEYSTFLQLLLSRVKPDVITLELLGWMDVGDLCALIEPSLLDPAALAAARKARDELAGVFWGPFTQQTHEDVYGFCLDTVRRLSPHTAVAVCHGTPATWKALGSRMRMSPERFICNCGPQSAPGGELYDKWNPGVPPASLGA